MRPAERACHLPWLAPSASAIAALATARRPWNDAAVANDPAAVALILRFQNQLDGPSLGVTPSERSTLLRFTSKRLKTTPIGVIASFQSLVTTLRIAEVATKIAGEEVSSVVRVTAILTALGRLALTKTCAASTYLETSVRLCRRWGLPGWCVANLANLVHGPALAESLAADARVIAALRAAAFLVDADYLPGLDAGVLADVQLSAKAGRKLLDETPAIEAPSYSNPYEAPHLLDLVRAAERVHRRDNSVLIRSLEHEVGRLHATLADRQRSEGERLHKKKLIAMAEFAAGAGHEINTPLAIISGQAQLLLQQEQDPDQRKALQAVVHQARRVHDILTELMQFARPARPASQIFDLGLVVRETGETLRESAVDRDISLDVDCDEGQIALGDPRQVRTIVHSLIRNAIEAAPDEGWVRARVESASGSLRVLVDDSGPGPEPAIVDHLFDPFFSGRHAGRGRGLGLPTAWRLAQEQGGDVCFDSSTDGLTRFVFTLPRADILPASERKSA